MLLQTALESVQVSFEQLDRLYRLQALEQQATTPESQTLIRLATEQCVNAVLTDSYNVSMESVGSVVGGAIDKVWDAIVKAIAWIWNSLKKLFGFEETIEKDNKDLKYKQDEIKDIIKKGNNNAKFDEVAYLPDSLTLPFEYTGHNEIKPEELIESFTALQNTLGSLETLSIHILNALNYINKASAVTPDIVLEAYAMVIQNIKQYFKVYDVSLDTLKRVSSNLKEVSGQDHRIIEHLLNGKTLCFIAFNYERFINYTYFNIVEPTSLPRAVKIQYMNLPTFATYPVKLEKVQTEYLNTQDKIYKNLKQIKIQSDKAIETLRKDNDPESISIGSFNILSLLYLSESIELAMASIGTDLHHYSAIFIENYNHYKTND